MNKIEVYINGEKWIDDHADFSGRKVPREELANCDLVRVPADSYYLLGDNRRNSLDSRSVGSISKSELIGTPNMICWSRERFFPVKWDTSRYELGHICWDRIGMPLK